MVKIYKVGGCVRDKILGIESQDIDYVVVGATIDHMQQLGLVPVGRHFPVFIEPKTGTQYALARTERKTSIGYHGFEFYATPDVTLEQDLQRRDLTINAIAEDENGQFIDPFHGIDDIKNKIIRHTSNAFTEDPLRVLRAARFKAKLGFSIASDTLDLMEQICKSNELEHLSKERIWDEVRKALACPTPLEFFRVLAQVGALEHILFEFKFLINNKTLYTKTKSDLDNAIKQDYSLEEKFAIIICDIAQHDPNIAVAICMSCKLGIQYKELGLSIAKNINLLLKLEDQNSNTILQIIKSLDPMRKKERFVQIDKVLTLTCTNTQQQLEFIKKAASCFEQIDYSKLDQNNKDLYIQAINNQKLTIISNLYNRFFGT